MLQNYTVILFSQESTIFIFLYKYKWRKAVKFVDQEVSE